MPVLSQTTSELTQHVFFPLIRQVSHRILSRLAFAGEIGDSIYINTDWSSHSKTSDIENNAIIKSQAFRVDAQLQMNPSSQKFETYTFQHTAAYGLGTQLLNLSQPVYLDTLNSVRVVETTSPVTIVMNCDLILQSTELAFQAPQRIFNAFENGAIHHFNDLVYDYPVPHAITSILYSLWKMDRLIGGPAGYSFKDYIRRNSDGLWQVHVDKMQKVSELVIPKFELKTIATMEYTDDKPSPVVVERIPIGFSIPFIYTIQFQLPSMNVLQYPVVYNNQYVPLELIPIQKDYGFNRMPESTDVNAYNDYRHLYDKTPILCKHVPDFDDWVFPGFFGRAKGKYTPMVIVAVTVDENETLSTEIDLKELKDQDWDLSEFCKETLYQQGENSLNSDVLYHVALFRGDKVLIPGEDYTFTEDLIVKFNALNLHHQYRIVIGSLNDVNKLHTDWNPWVKKYFPLVHPTIKQQIKQQIESGGKLNKQVNRLTSPDITVSNPDGTTSVISRKRYTSDLTYDKIALQSSPWRDPTWPPNTTIKDDGGIYDSEDNLICHATASEYPIERRVSYASVQSARINKVKIVTRRS